MYRTSVYTLVNGNIKKLAHRKQQKITKDNIACITLTESTMVDLPKLFICSTFKTPC